MRASCPGSALGRPRWRGDRGNPLKEACAGNPRPSSITFRRQKPLTNARGELPPGAGTLGRLTWPWLCAVIAMAGGRLQRSPSSALGPRPPRGHCGPDQPHVHTAWSGPARVTRQGQAGSGHTEAGPSSPHTGSATVVTRGLWRPARWTSPATAAESDLSTGCQQSTTVAFPGVPARLWERAS